MLKHLFLNMTSNLSGIHKSFLDMIREHPAIWACTSSGLTFMISLIDVSGMVDYLRLIGESIKVLGITAGTSVAVTSAIVYFKKLLKSKNPNEPAR